MALNISHRCRFPNDLDFATKQLDAELANRILANQQLLKDAELATDGLSTALDNGNNILNSLFPLNDATPSQRPTSEKALLESPDGALTVDNQPSDSYDTSSNLKSTEDVAEIFGLLPDNSTDEQEEKFISNTGIILLDHVAYLPGKQSGNPKYFENIKSIRRLYFSVDTNLSKTKEILKNNTKTTFVHDKLILRVVPPKSKNVAYTLKELQNLLQLDYLTRDDVVLTKNQESIVLLRSLLGIDKSKAEIYRMTGVLPEETISNVFHFDSVDNNSAAIARYNYLGYTGTELGAILDGSDLTTSSITTITDNLTATQDLVNKQIAFIDFLRSKYYRLSPSYRRSAFSQLRTALDHILKMHKKTISLSLFQVSIISQKDILDMLSLKHTDEKIEYLLRKRDDVDGIWVDAPDKEIMITLKRSMDATPPGSTFISNKAVNNKKNSVISQVELLNMYANLYDARQSANNSDLSLADLSSIRQFLVNFLARNPYTPLAAASQLYQGQPSATTTATILTDKLDVLTTMNFEAKKQAVKDSFRDLISIYPAKIALPLAEILDKITDLFEKALRAINRLLEQARRVLMALKKRLDAFISQYLTLTGSGSFEKSILKCSINWDIGLSTDILDILANFFFDFMGQLLGFLSKLKNWIADLLEKVLCLPADLLNNFLGQVSVSLPSACKIPRFNLGTQVETSLTNLKNVSITQQFVLQTFARDIAKLRIEVRAAPNKISQFKASSNCSSSASSNFMNASMLNVGVGVGIGG